MIHFDEVSSEEITKGFLNAILEEDITSVDLSQNVVLRRNNIQDKLDILNVLVHFNNSEVCNIEMQMISQTNIIQRLLYYWSKTYIKKSQDYSNLKRTICILIANFTLDNLVVTITIFLFCIFNILIFENQLLYFLLPLVQINLCF